MSNDAKNESLDRTIFWLKFFLVHIWLLFLSALLTYAAVSFLFTYSSRLWQFDGIKFWAFLLLLLVSIALGILGLIMCVVLATSLYRWKRNDVATRRS